jgi:hypothetical protein
MCDKRAVEDGNLLIEGFCILVGTETVDVGLF